MLRAPTWASQRYNRSNYIFFVGLEGRGNDGEINPCMPHYNRERLAAVLLITAGRASTMMGLFDADTNIQGPGVATATLMRVEDLSL